MTISAKYFDMTYHSLIQLQLQPIASAEAYSHIVFEGAIYICPLIIEVIFKKNPVDVYVTHRYSFVYACNLPVI